MSLVPFEELMAMAERGGYAIGYFESWNLESLLAVADAAEAVGSPVILGFSGIYLPHPKRRVREPLSVYAAMGLEICSKLRVPTSLLFNESPHLDAVRTAIACGFSLVMYSPNGRTATHEIAELVALAHDSGAAVEAEMEALPGAAGDIVESHMAGSLTDPDAAADFVASTRVDALAVNLGQAHLHGRRTVRLDLDRLDQIRQIVRAPLVLHGATSVVPEELRQAVTLGIRKVNVGSRLKRVYFEALRARISDIGTEYNPYAVIGSGLAGDVLVDARLALQAEVQHWMTLLGSAGRARS